MSRGSPWELVRPYDDEDPDRIVDDDFLCARFELTRWLAGRSGPAGSLHIRRVACLDGGQAPGQPPLPSVARERGYVAGLADRHGLEDRSPPQASGPAVGALLNGQQGEIDLWHFAGHGDVSVMVLADGGRVGPEDLYGPRQTAIGRRRPLVFLNACRAGQQTWSLTQLGGWAAAWAGRCRCGVFVGPLWSVTDEPAWVFARTFYDQVQAGRTLGQAVLTARVRTREHAPEDPTWLAYSVYAHPNARVVFTAAERLPATQTPRAL
ncbi:MAG: CHAT domain-containing protein [Egibacteraceae bacterium]